VGLLVELAGACEHYLKDHPTDISEQAREMIQNEPGLWAARCAMIVAAQPGPANLDDFWRMIAQPDAKHRVKVLVCRDLGEPKKMGARRK
jgi:hypothetical protein